MANLLVLAGGRRRYVVEEILRSKGDVDQLWVSDGDLLTPGVAVSGVRGFVEPNRPPAEWLPEFCRREGIGAVLSLHDYQAIAVSPLRDELLADGCLWIGPSYEVATTLLDKRSLTDFLTERSPTMSIPTYTRGEDLLDGVESWVVKDRLGSGSSGLQTRLDRAEAIKALNVGDRVAQPMVDGDEWNIDFFVRPAGRIEGASLKRKIRMRGGETDAAEVVVSGAPFDVEGVLEVFRGLDHLGNVDVDVFVDSGSVKVVDVNPRFGGGYAFSLHAGYRAAEAVWALVRGGEWDGEIAATSAFRGAKSIEVVGV